MWGLLGLRFAASRSLGSVPSCSPFSASRVTRWTRWTRLLSGLSGWLAPDFSASPVPRSALPQESGVPECPLSRSQAPSVPCRGRRLTCTHRGGVGSLKYMANVLVAFSAGQFDQIMPSAPKTLCPHQSSAFFELDLRENAQAPCSPETFCFWPLPRPLRALDGQSYTSTLFRSRGTLSRFHSRAMPFRAMTGTPDPRLEQCRTDSLARKRT